MSVEYNSVIAAGWRVESNKAILYPELDEHFIFEADGTDWMIAGVPVVRNENPGTSVPIDSTKLNLEQIEILSKIANAFGFNYSTAQLFLVNQVC